MDDGLEVQLPTISTPGWVIHPGEVLEMELIGRKLSVESFAAMCAVSYERMADLVDGKEPLTEDLAERFSIILGSRKQMWLNLERTFREGLAEGKTWR